MGAPSTAFRAALAAATAAAAFTGPVHAETLNGEQFACLSEQSLDEMTNAAVNEDKRGMRYLIDANRCILPKAGVPVSVLDSTWTGKVKVRAYIGDHAITLWTYREALAK